MRIKLIIRDREYCKALSQVIGQLGKKIIVEIGEPCNVEIDRDALVLTDLNEARINIENVQNLVLLTNNPNDVLDISQEGPYKLFKYNSITSILGDLEQIHYKISGRKETSIGILSRVFALCSDNDMSKNFAMSLARQILFRRGGNIAIVSMGYINNYSCLEEKDNSKFSRWMFYLDVNRPYSIECFVYGDSYGIDYLRLPNGLNPLAYMDLKMVSNFIEEICHKKYETLILDIGNCLSELNIRLLNKADNIIYFTSTNRFDIKDILLETNIDDALKTISVDAGTDLDLVLDEYVTSIYSTAEGN